MEGFEQEFHVDFHCVIFEFRPILYYKLKPGWEILNTVRKISPSTAAKFQMRVEVEMTLTVHIVISKELNEEYILGEWEILIIIR